MEFKKFRDFFHNLFFSNSQKFRVQNLGGRTIRTPSWGNPETYFSWIYRREMTQSDVTESCEHELKVFRS